MPKPIYRFKILDGHGRAPYQRSCVWPKVGEWTPYLDGPVLCARGWHVAIGRSLRYFLMQRKNACKDFQLYVCEVRGQSMRSDTCNTYNITEYKEAWSQARLVKKLGPPTKRGLVCALRAFAKRHKLSYYTQINRIIDILYAINNTTWLRVSYKTRDKRRVGLMRKLLREVYGVGKLYTMVWPKE